MEIAVMSLNKVAAMLASQLIKSELIYDDKAETCKEIADKLGFKRSFALNQIRRQIKAGKVEAVRKMVNGNSVVAYRVKLLK